jgi:hypothetical protein
VAYRLSAKRVSGSAATASIACEIKTYGAGDKSTNVTNGESKGVSFTGDKTFTAQLYVYGSGKVFTDYEFEAQLEYGTVPTPFENILPKPARPPHFAIPLKDASGGALGPLRSVPGGTCDRIIHDGAGGYILERNIAKTVLSSASGWSVSDGVAADDSGVTGFLSGDMTQGPAPEGGVFALSDKLKGVSFASRHSAENLGAARAWAGSGGAALEIALPNSLTGIGPSDEPAAKLQKAGAYLAGNNITLIHSAPQTLTPLHQGSAAAIRAAMSAIDGNIVITGTEIAPAGFNIHRDFGTAASAKNDAALAEAQARIADLEAAVLALGETS